jgi:hypothetical protein
MGGARPRRRTNQEKGAVKCRVAYTATAAMALLITAPLARADGDADYVERLEIYGIHGDANSIGWGHHICNRVAKGASPLAEAQELKENSPQMTEQQTYGEVDAALMTYCFPVTMQGVELLPTN